MKKKEERIDHVLERSAKKEFGTHHPNFAVMPIVEQVELFSTRSFRKMIDQLTGFVCLLTT